jgi:hypothetical protein
MARLKISSNEVADMRGKDIPTGKWFSFLWSDERVVGIVNDGSSATCFDPQTMELRESWTPCSQCLFMDVRFDVTWETD